MTTVNFANFIRIASDKEQSFEYFCNRLNALSCPGCGHREFYIMTRKLLRYKACKDNLKLLKDTKLSLLNLFELSISARKASYELHISYKTALKGFDIIRMAITESLSKSDDVLKGEIELDESYFGGK